MKILKRIIHRLVENPIISDFTQNFACSYIFGKKFKINIKKCIKLNINEKVFDLGCGTGRYSKLFNSEYVGVDIDKIHLHYANKKYGSPKKKFILMDGISLGFKDKCFDKSIFIGTLHHVNNVDTLNILKELSRVTKVNILIIDWTPIKYNIVLKYLQSMDRGKHIRTFEQQKLLINKILKTRKSYTSRCGMIVYSFFLCDL